MKITPTLKAFIDEMAGMCARESGRTTFQEAQEEYTAQILEDDAAWLVRYAMDSGVQIPRQLSKFKEEAKDLY